MLRYKVQEVFQYMPRLETPRLILRKLTKDDAQDMFEFSRLPEVSEYLLWDTHTSLRYTKSYLNDLLTMYRNFEYFEWAVVEKETERMIGTCGFTKFHYSHNTGEIGYSLNPARWGQGFATEAAQATVAFGFERLELSRIEACYALENIASERVLAHCGMCFVGETDPMWIKGTKRRVGISMITREAYMAMNDRFDCPVG